MSPRTGRHRVSSADQAPVHRPNRFIGPIDPSASERLRLHPTSVTPAGKCGRLNRDLLREHTAAPPWTDHGRCRANHTLASECEEESIDAGLGDAVHRITGTERGTGGGSIPHYSSATFDSIASGLFQSIGKEINTLAGVSHSFSRDVARLRSPCLPPSWRSGRSCRVCGDRAKPKRLRCRVLHAPRWRLYDATDSGTTSAPLKILITPRVWRLMYERQFPLATSVSRASESRRGPNLSAGTSP